MCDINFDQKMHDTCQTETDKIMTQGITSAPTIIRSRQVFKLLVMPTPVLYSSLWFTFVPLPFLFLFPSHLFYFLVLITAIRFGQRLIFVLSMNSPAIQGRLFALHVTMMSSIHERSCFIPTFTITIMKWGTYLTWGIVFRITITTIYKLRHNTSKLVTTLIQAVQVSHKLKQQKLPRTDLLHTILHNFFFFCQICVMQDFFLHGRVRVSIKIQRLHTIFISQILPSSTKKYFLFFYYGPY